MPTRSKAKEKEAAPPPSPSKGKRKATSEAVSPKSTTRSAPTPKKQKTLDGGILGESKSKTRRSDTEKAKPSHSDSKSYEPHSASSGRPVEEEFGIIDRRYYPKQMSVQRAKEYMDRTRTKPIDLLEQALSETSKERAKVSAGEAVVHWFKCDTRVHDNHALHLAGTKAKEAGVPLVCVYLVSPQDFEAHATAPIRVDFIMRNLHVLRDDLAELDIPLHVEIVAERKNVSARLLELCAEWGAHHVFANIEYEADELRREARLVRQGVKRGVAVTAVHDTCVVPPGRLTSGSGNQYSVYSPWYRAWMKHIHEHGSLLETFAAPPRNPGSARKQQKFAALFDCAIPDPATEPSLESKRLAPDEQQRYRSYWPAGEHEAAARLRRFVADKIKAYADTRNLPGENATALLSCHFAAGTISARTAVRAARDANSSSKLDVGAKGIVGWISEVAWRDFYKHVMVHWPYIVFSVPFKPEYNDVPWDYDRDKFDAWAHGRTGFPIVDAAVRQMHQMGYIHNRCRMIVASFLCKDLLQDWRMGERYFMEHLIDGDFASNNGGWGFSSSAGVDPQPYFRIFNPLLQSEKFDVDGDYIRKWIPELKDVKGKAIHDPYGRGAGAIAKKNGYPEPMVDHKEARDKALKMYKKGLGRDTA